MSNQSETASSNPNILTEKDSLSGLDKIKISGPRGSSAEVFLYGGQVASWKSEEGEELLFMSSKAVFKPPKPIRGGIAICFPQLGPLGSLEKYGFGRNRMWSIDPNPPQPPSMDMNAVDLLLKHTSEDLKICPHNDVRVEGLETLDYLDNLLGRQRFTEQGDSISFDCEVDRVYLSAPQSVAVIDHKKKRTFVLHKNGFPDAAVWNPWDKKSKAMVDFGNDEYIQMVCIEAAAVEKPIALKPGEEWIGRQELEMVSANYLSRQMDPVDLKGKSL